MAEKDETVRLSPGARDPEPDAQGEDDRLAPNTKLDGRYRLIRFVARGGMGDVYEAVDEELRTTIAVKTVRSYLAHDPSILERVRREAQLARSVTHPNVCRIFDLGHAKVGERRVTYITMEFLTGVSLRHRLRDHGVMAPADALPIALDIINGLDACHRADVIHRDLKPENILLVNRGDREHAVLTDFGVARPTIDATDGVVTRDGVLVGSIAYMPPELFDGARATAQSDIYGVGAILWDLTVGPWPFCGKETLEIMRSYARGELIDELPEHLDPTWAQVIRTCLAPRAERYTEAWQIGEALTGTLTDVRPPPRRSSKRLTPQAQVVTATVATVRSTIPRRRRWHVTGGVALVVAVAATTALIMNHKRPRGREPPTIATVEDALERLEFGRALELAKGLDDRAARAVPVYLVARAQAGLGRWRDAAAAVASATSARDGLTRQMSLELEGIDDASRGDLVALVPVLDALAITAPDDARLGLEHAEVLIALGRDGEAERVLHRIGTLSLAPVTAARLALDRALRLYNIAGVDLGELGRAADAAVAAAVAIDAKVMNGRALAIRAKSLIHRGRPDEAATDIARAMTLLEAAGDRRGLVIATYVAAVIATNTESDPAVPLAVAQKAVAAAELAADKLHLCLDENVVALADLGLGRVSEAVDAEQLAIQACTAAKREDLADTRPRPNLVEIEIDLGRVTAALTELEELHARRGPDRDGREEQNYIRLFRYRGDLVSARRHVTMAEAVIDKTKGQNFRAGLYIEEAMLAFEADDAAAHSAAVANADAMLKAAGSEGDEEATLLLAKALPLIDTDPAAAASLLAKPHAGSTSFGKGMLTVLAGQASLRLGKRPDAVAQLAAYRTVPAYDQFAELRIQARMFAAELAAHDQRAAVERELAELRERSRADGFVLGTWSAELALASLAHGRGDDAAARELATGVEHAARAGGCARLARLAAALLRTLRR